MWNIRHEHLTFYHCLPQAVTTHISKSFLCRQPSLSCLKILCLLWKPNVHYHVHAAWCWCLSSSSSSYIFHGVGPLVDPFRSHVSRSLFKGLPWFLLPVGEQCFITLGNLFRGILFTCCIQLLLYSSNLSQTGVIFSSFAICAFVLQSVQVHPAVLLTYFICAAVILLASLAWTW